MKLLDLYISGFGKFHDRSIIFDDGLNIVYGKNEAGKSTLHTFIRCMLFGLERGRGRASKNDTYTKYEPWDNKAVYGGRLRLEHNGSLYRLERSFQKDQKSFVIIDETRGREIAPTAAFMDQLLCGLNEITYSNTISIGQLKSATDGGMVSELKNYIANMNTSGNMSLNITKATSYLKAKRRELERQSVPEAAKSYASNLSEIRSIEKEISAPEYENQLPAYQTMRFQVKGLLTEKQDEREALLQKIATGRQALAGSQFTDEASITTYRDEALKTYQEYHVSRAATEKKSRMIVAVICWLCAAVFGIGTAVFALPTDFRNAYFYPLSYFITNLIGKEMPSLWVVIFGILCFILAAIGIFLAAKNKRYKKDLEYSSKLLQEIFSRHLGDSAISDEAMEAFQKRMEEFIRLSQILVRSEDAMAKQVAEITALQERENTCNDVISQQQRTQWELEKKLEHLTSLKDHVESLKHVLAENERIHEEMAAIDLALDTMTELSASIRDSFGLYLNKTASQLIDGITGGIYNSMSVDENLNVFMNTKTKLVPVEQVSSGTMDQIYLALRLAAAKLIQADGGSDPLPLIFDDSFVLYDDERLRTALKWLTKAYSGQVIIFTCHQREAQMLTANQIAYHLVSI